MNNEVARIYEHWLEVSGVRNNYTERMGALALLLWLKEAGLLKEAKQKPLKIPNLKAKK